MQGTKKGKLNHFDYCAIEWVKTDWNFQDKLVVSLSGLFVLATISKIIAVKLDYWNFANA